MGKYTLYRNNTEEMGQHESSETAAQAIAALEMSGQDGEYALLDNENGDVWEKEDYGWALVEHDSSPDGCSEECEACLKTGSNL